MSAASSFWRDRNVFVTGGTGLLGSWIVQDLLDAGANVTSLVRDWVPGSRFVEAGLDQRANVVHGELEDFPTLVRTMNEYEVDTVFHLAAQAVVGAANRTSLSTFEANIRGTWNVLEAAHACARVVQRVVVASSDKAYGEHVRLPYTEDTPLQGRYPYDVSKSCADLIALSYYHTYRTPVAVTRCGNLIGPGDLNYNRLIPGTIRSVLRGEVPIVRSDGSFVRDYFYVRDAVSAYLDLATHMPDDDFVGQAFNFSNEQPLSVLELVGLILRLMGRCDLEPVVLNNATHEIHAQYLDCTKAHQRLGWRPAYSIEEGLLQTIAWYTARFEAEPCVSLAGM